jgi:hypothetical protein
LLRRWSRAKAGEGHGVLLERLTAEPHTRMHYFCSPQHAISALFPIIGQMQRAAGLAHDDAPGTRLDKLDALLAQTSTSIDTPHCWLRCCRSPPTLAALVWQLEALTRTNPVRGCALERPHEPGTVQSHGGPDPDSWRAADRDFPAQVRFLGIA